MNPLTGAEESAKLAAAVAELTETRRQLLEACKDAAWLLAQLRAERNDNSIADWNEPPGAVEKKLEAAIGRAERGSK